MPWLPAAISIGSTVIGAAQQAQSATQQADAQAEQADINAGIARSQALSDVAITTFNEARALQAADEARRAGRIVSAEIRRTGEISAFELTRAGQIESAEVLRKTEEDLSTLRAARGASGFAATGTPLLLQFERAKVGAIDVAEVGRAAGRGSFELLRTADLDAAETFRNAEISARQSESEAQLERLRRVSAQRAGNLLSAGFSRQAKSALKVGRLQAGTALVRGGGQVASRFGTKTVNKPKV